MKICLLFQALIEVTYTIVISYIYLIYLNTKWANGSDVKKKSVSAMLYGWVEKLRKGLGTTCAAMLASVSTASCPVVAKVTTVRGSGPLELLQRHPLHPPNHQTYQYISY